MAVLITFVYVSNNEGEWCQLWSDLVRIVMQYRGKKWLAWGDYNKILFLHERSNWATNSNYSLAEFWCAISTTRLQELEYVEVCSQGSMGGREEVCMSKIDCVLVSEEWHHTWPMQFTREEQVTIRAWSYAWEEILGLETISNVEHLSQPIGHHKLVEDIWARPLLTEFSKKNEKRTSKNWLNSLLKRSKRSTNKVE